MIVFLHGVPETAVIWNKVRAAIDQESVALELPGFGCPRPDDFGATKDDYVRWLLGELDGIDGPIDLVGHDWGAGLTYRVATAHGDRLHSWVADIGNIAHPDYEWHDFAKLWQTPGEGETFMEGMVSAPASDRAALLNATGVPELGALPMAEAFDATMAAAILTLYRSSTDIGNEWGPGIDSIRGPGLLLESMQDPFRNADRVRRLADRTGAEVVQLPDEGHW